MSLPLRIAMAQINTLVGDINGNVELILGNCVRARDELGAHVVVFPELALVGYPPEDLLLRPGFLRAAQQGLARILGHITGIDIILGHPLALGGQVFNVASLLREREIVATYRKQQLPNYGVFDEARYFHPGEHPCVVDIRGVPVGLTICEDIWHERPMQLAVDAGARVVINLNASPFHAGKCAERREVVRQRVAETGVPVVYVNQVGGQDELVFDGDSFVMDSHGEVRASAPLFEQQLLAADFLWDEGQQRIVAVEGKVTPAPDELEMVYQALVTGVRDYVGKNGFPGVVIGLSGGIDSALTLAIAVDALGAAAVETVMMPSRYTAAMSLEDARAMADTLRVGCREISIESVYDAFVTALREEFCGLMPDVTEENIQARCRGVLLMAISNKKHKVVLTTGNKSEMAVGYATLYGDMAGGFDVLKDVPKTLVYRLSEYRNRIASVIPQRIIDRPPSAELAPDQKDTDSLPPYEVLDAILELYVEQDFCPEDIAARGFDAATVERVARMVDRNEYKRRQAAPGVRISRRAFGKDRRYPITCGYRRS